MNFKKEDRKNHFEEYEDIDNFDSDDFYYVDIDNTNKSKKNIKLTDILCIIIIVLLVVILIGKFDFFKDDSKVVSSTNQNEVISSQEEDYKNIEVSNNQNIQPSNNQVETLYIQSTSQTSQLYDVTNKDYSSSKVLDGDFSTVWSEGVTGYGHGEWIKLNFAHVQTVNTIKIVNGLVNGNNGYYKNNRVESLILEFSDGSTQTVYLQDNNTSYQTIQISPVDTTYVKCIINSVYPGSKYNDTCIADIRLLGY